VTIVYTCHDAFPSSDINTQQIFRTVLEVTRLGVEVELTIPAWSEALAERAAAAMLAGYYGAAGEDVPPLFRVRAIGTRPPDGQLGRGLFDLRTASYLRGRRLDFCWTRDPLAAASLARRGCPVVFETFRGDFATRPVFAPWRRVLLGNPNLRGVITHSLAAADAFAAAGVPRERCLAAHNGFAPSLMTPELTRAEARHLTGLPLDRKLIVYTGHPARDKGIRLMVDIAEGVPDATVVVLGAAPSLPESRWLSSEAARRGVSDRLILRPRVPPAAVAPYLYAADCLVVTPYARRQERHRRQMLPIKVFGYLAAGRAILAPRLSDIEEVLTDDRTARLYDPENPADAMNAAAALIGNDSVRDRLGREAKATSTAYTWSARARRIVDFFDSVVAGQPRSAMAAAASSRR
jgi:glycosyltransferase involved in cell wall biosynthesis